MTCMTRLCSTKSPSWSICPWWRQFLNPVCFKFATKIYDFVQSRGFDLDEYNVFVETDLLKKPYTNNPLYWGKNSKAKYDEILGIEFFDIKSKHDGLLAWGWYSISSFRGVMPDVNERVGSGFGDITFK